MDADRDGHSNAAGNGDADRISDGNANLDANSYSNADSDRNGDGDGHTDCDTNGHVLSMQELLECLHSEQSGVPGRDGTRRRAVWRWIPLLPAGDGDAMREPVHIGDATLYCAAWRDTCQVLADASIDAILTDLPYGTTACSWDTIIPFAPMWAEVKRVLKPRGVFVTTASQPFTSALVMSNVKWFRYEWIWHKNLATGHLNAHMRPMLEHESILVFSDGNEVYLPQGIRAYGRMNRRGGNGDNYGPSGLLNLQEYTAYPRSILDFNVHRSINQHSTQKPIALYEYLVRTYTNEGDTVLDFCFGSGTTAVACMNTGRRFIGGDNSQEYVDVAVRRIEAAQMQLRMAL